MPRASLSPASSAKQTFVSTIISPCHPWSATYIIYNPLFHHHHQHHPIAIILLGHLACSHPRTTNTPHASAAINSYKPSQLLLSTEPAFINTPNTYKPSQPQIRAILICKPLPQLSTHQLNHNHNHIPQCSVHTAHTARRAQCPPPSTSAPPTCAAPAMPHALSPRGPDASLCPSLAVRSEPLLSSPTTTSSCLTPSTTTATASPAPAPRLPP